MHMAFALLLDLEVCHKLESQEVILFVKLSDIFTPKISPLIISRLKLNSKLYFNCLSTQQTCIIGTVSSKMPIFKIKTFFNVFT